MNPPTNEVDRTAFESSVPYENARMAAAALYCSDGRFGEHVDDFLHNALQLPRYDRLVVPGGAACLAGRPTTEREEAGVMAQLTFLVLGHKLRRVVLIAHEDCAFYRHGLGLPVSTIEPQQHDDLAKAAARVRAITPNLQVDSYFARCVGNAVHFEPLVGA